MLCWKNIGWQTLRRAHKCKEQTTNLRYIIRYIFVSRKPQCGRTLSGLLCGSIVQALHEAFNLHITHAPVYEGGSLLWPRLTHQDYTSSCSHRIRQPLRQRVSERHGRQNMNCRCPRSWAFLLRTRSSKKRHSYTSDLQLNSCRGTHSAHLGRNLNLVLPPKAQTTTSQTMNTPPNCEHSNRFSPSPKTKQKHHRQLSQCQFQLTKQICDAGKQHMP